MTISNVPEIARNHLDRANCTVVAFAAALDRPYVQTRDELLQAGIYKRGSGSQYFGQLSWMRAQGRLLIDVGPQYRHEMPTLAQFIRNADRNKTYIIYISRHCIALVRGKHVDTCVKMRARVRAAFEVVTNEQIAPSKTVAPNAVVKFLVETGYAYNVHCLAGALQITEKQVRSQIDRARKQGFKIVCTKGAFGIER